MGKVETEAPPKWLCKECGDVCGEPLTAPNPFEPADTLHACPTCKTVGDLIKACDYDGCTSMATCGDPDWLGFRYASTCSTHSKWRAVKALPGNGGVTATAARPGSGDA